jgi:hypothetical protein
MAASWRNLMDKILKLLQMAFHVIILFMALTLLYTMSRKFTSLTEKTADIIMKDNILYEAHLDKQEHYITHAELIAILLEDIEYDIEVVDKAESYKITAETYSPSDIELYIFVSRKFKKSYVYNINGTIAKIRYLSAIE